MHIQSLGVALLCCGALCMSGCFTRSESPPPSAASEPLAWVEERLENNGAVIMLGFRGPGTPSSKWEPVAAITDHDGKPVAGAMVFVQFVTADAKETQGPEFATQYEPGSEQAPALYTPGKLPAPEGASTPSVRFRIVLPESEEDFVQEIPLPHAGRV